MLLYRCRACLQVISPFRPVNASDFKGQRIITLGAFELSHHHVLGFKSGTRQRYSGRVIDKKADSSGVAGFLLSAKRLSVRYSPSGVAGSGSQEIMSPG